MNCGYFDDSTSEYVITSPHTPVKWINYVGDLRFGGIVDHTGGAVICRGDPALNRITKYIPQLPASDFRGNSVYIRIKKEGKIFLWSPFYSPVLENLDHWECRVGLGYNCWNAEKDGIRVLIRSFVADGVFIQDVTTENRSGISVEVDVVPVVEFSHFDALKQLTNADWVPQTMILNSRVLGNLTVLEQYAFMNRETGTNWFGATVPIASFEGDRQKFLGMNGYGSWASPMALERRNLSNSTCSRGDNIGALQISLGFLAPGQTARFATVLGQGARAEANSLLEKFRDPVHLDEAFGNLGRFWKGFLGTLSVSTPDPAFDSMVNIHNPRQCHTTKNWSRDLSLYQLGLGGRGMGYRDSSQDVLGAMSLMPGECRELIEKILSVQLRDGKAMHQFLPSTMEASEGDSREYPDRPHWYGDDHLWPVFSAAAYVAETGDLGWLDREVPFYEKDRNGRVLESASVYEHLKRAVAFTAANTGVHGLPLLGFADWNDTVNLPAGAESLFIANQYGKALQDLGDLARSRGDFEYVAGLEQLYQKMKRAVEDHGWDGKWYVRYFDDKGSPIGTNQAEKGKIWINSNTWSVISGFASPDRAAEALGSVKRHLNTRYGLKLSAPGYDGFDPQIGGVTTYPPGAKENGGIFLHTNPWAIIAETMVGDGDQAFEYYCQINPAAKNDMIEIYEAEPYCYPQNILGDEHPQFGLARNTWLSGTSSWAYVAATQYILGIRPEVGGLRIDPCIPKGWRGFKVVRKFRGITYRISVSNPLGICKGVSSMRIDDQLFPGNLIPQGPAVGDHQIEVVLGQ